MLYIKFEIKDSSRFEDFQKLYDHMVKVRQPGFKFDDVGPEFDWDGMKTQEEVDAAVEELNTFLDQQVEPEIYRCKALLPSYVKVFLESYLQGAQDPRVLQVESDEIVAGVRENGVPVEYVLFEDEGHGFVKKENQIESYSRILKFLDKYLKNENIPSENKTETTEIEDV